MNEYVNLYSAQLEKTSRALGELVKRWKKIYGYKNFCVYFTYLPRSPRVQIYMKFCMRHHLAVDDDYDKCRCTHLQCRQVYQCYDSCHDALCL